MTFVRVNGNRVIRVELAKLGQPLEVYTKDEVEGLMTTDGKPVVAAVEHPVQLGDAHRDPDKQAPEAPPTLRAPGEKLPQDDPNQRDPAMGREGAMKPVIFPKDTTKDPAHTVDAHPDATKPDATKPAADGTPADKSADKPADKPADKSDSKPDDKPQAAPAQPQQPPASTPPSSNFYPERPQPATL